MSFSQDEYINYAKKLGRSEDLIQSTVEYAKRLDAQNLPVIFSTHHLALHLEIPIDFLFEIISNRSRFYKYYEIKKRNGNGTRQILAPHATLKSIQKFINENILSKIPTSDYSFGFKRGKSIYDNAIIHSNKNAILNVDLLKFFDTICENRVFGIFHSLGYTKNVSVDLAKLVTAELPVEYINKFDEMELKAYREIVPIGKCVLPQGAPTSPILSNLILRRLDLRLSILAKKINVAYSRYADDITFSGDSENLPRIKLLRHIIRDEGFNINWKKVGIYKKGRRQMVTGLTVSNDVHIHRNFKKDVKKHIYGCLNFGVENHIKHIKSDEKKLYKEWLLGKILFINSIEPEQAQSLFSEFNKISWPI